MTNEQKAFINGAQAEEKGKTFVMLRVSAEQLAVIDRMAAQVGLRRAPFILSAAVDKANRMERERTD